MPRNPFLFNTHDLPRRPGEMREYELDISEHEVLGFDVLAIAKDELIEIDLKIESVADGVLASANVRTLATGECGRCLDPVAYEVDESFKSSLNIKKIYAKRERRPSAIRRASLPKKRKMT